MRTKSREFIHHLRKISGNSTSLYMICMYHFLFPLSGFPPWLRQKANVKTRQRTKRWQTHDSGPEVIPVLRTQQQLTRRDWIKSGKVFWLYVKGAQLNVFAWASGLDRNMRSDPLNPIPTSAIEKNSEHIIDPHLHKGYLAPTYTFLDVLHSFSWRVVSKSQYQCLGNSLGHRSLSPVNTWHFQPRSWLWSGFFELAFRGILNGNQYVIRLHRQTDAVWPLLTALPSFFKLPDITVSWSL